MYMYSSRKCPYPSPEEGIRSFWGEMGVGGRNKKKRNVRSLIGISWQVGGGIRKGLFHMGGMDIFFYYTVNISSTSDHYFFIILRCQMNIYLCKVNRDLQLICNLLTSTSMSIIINVYVSVPGQRKTYCKTTY